MSSRGRSTIQVENRAAIRGSTQQNSPFSDIHNAVPPEFRKPVHDAIVIETESIMLVTLLRLRSLGCTTRTRMKDFMDEDITVDAENVRTRHAFECLQKQKHRHNMSVCSIIVSCLDATFNILKCM